MTNTIGIYIYPKAEVLDYAGPFEVFNTASRMHTRLNPSAEALLDVVLIGASHAPIATRYGFIVQPHYAITDHPHLDVLVIPGGIHTDELTKPHIINWVAKTAAQTRLTASVCTGAFILAQAGIITNQSVTTHWEDIPNLRAMFPTLDVRENTPWVDNGNIICSAGISAGIEMSLHLVARLASKELALRTAHQMEYEWRNANLSDQEQPS